MEKLLSDDAGLIGHVDAGKRKAIVASSSPLLLIVRGDQGVKNAELPDHRRIRIRQKLVRHVMPLRERAQLLLAIVAHAIDTDIFSFEQLQVILQLDQLRSTVWSPDRRAIEHDDGLGIAPIGVIIDETTLLIQ